MKNKLLLSTAIFALTLLPIISSAKDSADLKRNWTSTSTEARINAEVEFETRKNELKERKEELKNEMENRRENLRSTSTRETIKNEIEAKKESIKDEVEKRKENAIGKIQERLNKFTENIMERFSAALERLQKLADRIDGRIAKMEAQNIDVKTAKELMLVARLKLETASTSVTGIGLESGAIASSTATTTAAIKDDFQHLKNQVEKAKKDIKSAHASLVDVVNSLKPGRNKTATSTREND